MEGFGNLVHSFLIDLSRFLVNTRLGRLLHWGGFLDKLWADLIGGGVGRTANRGKCVMLPIVEVPETIRNGMLNYRDVFCRDEGFDHVSRYVTGLIISPNKTLQGIYDLQVWDGKKPSRRSTRLWQFLVAWRGHRSWWIKGLSLFGRLSSVPLGNLDNASVFL